MSDLTPLSDVELDQLRAYCANNDSHGPRAVENLTNLRRLLAEADRIRAENVDLAAKLDAVQKLHVCSEAVETVAHILVGSDWDDGCRITDIGSRETVAHMAEQIVGAVLAFIADQQPSSAEEVQTDEH